MKKHEKHAKLTKPAVGFFGRNEFALVGAPCDIIEKTAQQITKILQSRFTQICYVDADHSFNEEEKDIPIYNVLQDKISHKCFEKKEINTYDQKLLLNQQNLILANGNHFEANKQIVFIYAAKEASLKKRIDQLTDVKAFVVAEAEMVIYDWLKSAIQNHDEIPVYVLGNEDELSLTISENCATPTLKALILAGGESQRMGEEKAMISYHKAPQKYHLYSIFKKMGVEPFISVRKSGEESNINVIEDKFFGIGPYGAILSAFQTDPNAAWLVMACDLPLINETEIKFLINNRNQNKLATACFNSETNFPDPLFTIWEPCAYLQLLSYLSLGYSCPRKVLINSNIELLNLPNSGVLKNANTPSEKQEAAQTIRQLKE